MILVATTLFSSLLLLQEPQDPPSTEEAAAEETAAEIILGPFDPPPVGYRTPAQLADALQQRAAVTDAMRLVRIATSPEGNPLLIASFPGPRLGNTAAPGSPEILIVANLEGDRIAASEVAMGIIDRFADQGSPLLEAATVHILPVANPDAMQHVLAGDLAWRGAPTDEDRDGQVDEDGPQDLDGDGHIL